MTFETILMYALLVILGLLLVGSIAVWVIKRLVDRLGKGGALFFLAIACFSVFASFPTSQEKKYEKIHFYHASTDTVYLIDNGSFISNNTVHVDFVTRLLPDSAMIYLDYVPKGEEGNPNSYSTYFASPSGEFPRTMDFEFENAISNRWMMYTTYTPGPVVHTNGVAVAEFLKAPDKDNVAIPKRATIWEDGKKVWPLNIEVKTTTEEEK